MRALGLAVLTITMAGCLGGDKDGNNVNAVPYDLNDGVFQLSEPIVSDTCGIFEEAAMESGNVSIVATEDTVTIGNLEFTRDINRLVGPSEQRSQSFIESGYDCTINSNSLVNATISGDDVVDYRGRADMTGVGSDCAQLIELMRAQSEGDFANFTLPCSLSISATLTPAAAPMM